MCFTFLLEVTIYLLFFLFCLIILYHLYVVEFTWMFIFIHSFIPIWHASTGVANQDLVSFLHCTPKNFPSMAKGEGVIIDLMMVESTKEALHTHYFFVSILGPQKKNCCNPLPVQLYLITFPALGENNIMLAVTGR